MKLGFKRVWSSITLTKYGVLSIKTRKYFIQALFSTYGEKANRSFGHAIYAGQITALSYPIGFGRFLCILITKQY